MEVATHGHPHYPNATLSNPEDLQRVVDEEEVSEMRRALEDRVPDVSKGEHVSSASCMYTFTPNEHFLLDWHPEQPSHRVLLVSPCSGHGFKFGSVIGHCCASLLTKGEYVIDISLFGIEKHQNTA